MDGWQSQGSLGWTYDCAPRRKAPRTKEIGQVSCVVASSATTWQYGLCLDQLSCENSARWTEGGSQWQDGARPSWSEGLLLKSLVSVFSRPWRRMSIVVNGVDQNLWGKCTTSRECQTKYLAVSPVMDNYEQLSLELFGRSPHPNFLTIKFDG